MRKRVGLGLQMVKFPFRGVSKGVSWDSSQRGLRGFHECSWSYLLMQDWLHHCLSEQPLAEHCKSICWTQTHPPQVSWMEGQTTVENKVADLNSYHIQLGLNLQMIPLPGSKKALPCSVTAHPAGLGGPGAPQPSPDWSSPGLLPAKAQLPLPAAAHGFPAEGCSVFALPLWLTGLSSSPFTYLIIPERARTSYKYGNRPIIMTTKAHSGTVCGKSRFSPVSVHFRFPPSGGISKLINNIWWL